MSPTVQNGFVTVARVEDVPAGTIRGFEVDDEEIAVAHCDGGFYAVHRGSVQLRTYDVQVEDGELRVRV